MLNLEEHHLLVAVVVKVGKYLMLLLLLEH